MDGFSKTLDEVISSVLTRRREGEFGPGLLAYLPEEADQIEVSSKIGFDKIFTTETELKEVIIPKKPLNIKEGFELAMQRYANRHQEELLIIIDEFETVKNKALISQYLKSAKNVRFVLVGIASTTLELIGQHASIARDTHAIELPPMSKIELEQILDLSSYILEPICHYTDDAKNAIVHHSHASPYWCHFLAKALLQNKMENTGSFEKFMRNTSWKIKQYDVNLLLDQLPERSDCKIYEEALKQITMGDDITSKILLGLAEHKQSVISSALVLNEIGKSYKIDGNISSKTIDDILQLPNSPLEERGRIRDIVSFSFRDPNFKRYILLRRADLNKGL
ncbi:MAG: hypothetical protein GY755_22100 [Chloroflexi bacterium]|nr:hypothetical protein [Chloroflexota bacterium]